MVIASFIPNFENTLLLAEWINPIAQTSALVNTPEAKGLLQGANPMWLLGATLMVAIGLFAWLILRAETAMDKISD